MQRAAFLPLPIVGSTMCVYMCVRMCMCVCMCVYQYTCHVGGPEENSLR